MLGIGLVLAGVSFGLCLWVLGGPWARHASLRQEEPEPFWWPWVLAIEPGAQALVTWRTQHDWRTWAPRAGMHPRWNANRWMAARLLAAAIAGIAGGLLALGATDLLSYRWVLILTTLSAMGGYAAPKWQLHAQAAQRRQTMQQELPFALDLLTLCVEAGLGLSAALQQVARWAPSGLLRDSLQTAASLERTGVMRSQWLKRWAQDTDVPGVHHLVFALLQADRLGMSLAPVLKAQAERQRSERFQRAEKKALEAPVKMLFPMVLCIFPCTFMVIAFPVVVKFLELVA